MICATVAFYEECIAGRCPICGVPPGEACLGEPWLEDQLHVHMQRGPKRKANPGGYDPMLHPKRKGLSI